MPLTDLRGIYRKESMEHLAIAKRPYGDTSFIHQALLDRVEPEDARVRAYRYANDQSATRRTSR